MDLLQKWTSLQINCCSVSKPHRDSGNAGPSLIFALGEYEGGELEVDGRLHSIRDAAMTFDGNQLHASYPFTGERWSIVAYFHEHLQSLKEDLKQQLELYNFQPETKQQAKFVRMGSHGQCLVRQALVEQRPSRAPHWRPPASGDQASPADSSSGRAGTSSSSSAVGPNPPIFPPLPIFLTLRKRRAPPILQKRILEKA